MHTVHTPTSQLVGMTAIELIAVAAEYDIIIDREHFVQMWHERFGDALPFVRATFDAYDENKDGKLSVLEIENIRLHALDKAGTLIKGAPFYFSLVFTFCKRQPFHVI